MRSMRIRTSSEPSRNIRGQSATSHIRIATYTRQVLAEQLTQPRFGVDSGQYRITKANKIGR